MKSTALELDIDGGFDGGHGYQRRLSRDSRLHVIDGDGGGDLLKDFSADFSPMDRPCDSKALATVISLRSLPVVEISEISYNPNPSNDDGFE